MTPEERVREERRLVIREAELRAGEDEEEVDLAYSQRPLHIQLSPSERLQQLQVQM